MPRRFGPHVIPDGEADPGSLSMIRESDPGSPLRYGRDDREGTAGTTGAGGYGEAPTLTSRSALRYAAFTASPGSYAKIGDSQRSISASSIPLRVA